MAALDRVEGASWTHIDVALQTIAKGRGVLDAIEARWLREALRVKIWREVGCVSMADYLERRLGYAPRTAYERVRIAVALEKLPKLAAALEAGLPHSAVRELTRVCTRDNEQRWLDATRDKSVHQIEAMVSGHERGSDPDDPKDEELVGRPIRFEGITPATEALLREAYRKYRQDNPSTELSENEFLAKVLRVYLEDGHGEREKAPFQIAVTVCEACNRGWQDSGGRQYPLSKAELERAACDAERIGSVDVDQPARAEQEVPPSVRRLVTRRDKGRCRVPGCRSTRCLEVHHIVARILGGGHEPENLILLCDSCHAALHDGLITISGTSSDLVVRRTHEVSYAQIEQLACNEIATGVRDADNSTAHVGTDALGVVRDSDEPAHTPVSTAHVGNDNACTAHVGNNNASTAHVGNDNASAHVGTSRFERERMRADARSALVGLGYKPTEAGAAVDLAMRRLEHASIEDVIREALRSCSRT